MLSKVLRLKTRSSLRKVPIHPLLIRCGLLDFVTGSEGRLFPTLPEHRSGRLSDGFGKHFARFLKALEIKTKKTDFHSFRHNFADRADASGMDFGTRERLLGHGLPGEAGRYGSNYGAEQQDWQLLHRRAEEMRLLAFPGVDIAHLYVDRETQT